jgi:hypothetical protein
MMVNIPAGGVKKLFFSSIFLLLSTPSIPNYKTFDFFDTKTPRLIQKFIQNINSFIVAWYINKSSSRMT